MRLGSIASGFSNDSPGPHRRTRWCAGPIASACQRWSESTAPTELAAPDGPQRLLLSTTYQQVSAGGFHTCAATADAWIAAATRIRAALGC